MVYGHKGACVGIFNEKRKKDSVQAGKLQEDLSFGVATNADSRTDESKR